MESQVPEVSRVCLVRRETKDREVSQDLQVQLVCRWANQYIKSGKLWFTHRSRDWKNLNWTSPSPLGSAWSTWRERWNWRRGSDGKTLCPLSLIVAHTLCKQDQDFLFFIGSTWPSWSQRPLRTPRSWWPSGTSWWYWKPRCCRRKGECLICL